jgi:hypothetical protein
MFREVGVSIKLRLDTISSERPAPQSAQSDSSLGTTGQYRESRSSLSPNLSSLHPFPYSLTLQLVQQGATPFPLSLTPITSSMDSGHSAELKQLGITYEALLDFVHKQRIGTEASN